MSLQVFTVRDEPSGRLIEARVLSAGADPVIVVTGGDTPHIGSVVLAQPTRSRPSCSVLTIPPHREEPIARPIAEAVCRACGRPTVVTAGIHEDDIDSEGITTYLELAACMAEKLAEHFR